jgi:hypothetical protein
MDTVLRRLRAPFQLTKFEDDAAFVYAVASTHTPNIGAIQ